MHLPIQQPAFLALALLGLTGPASPSEAQAPHVRRVALSWTVGVGIGGGSAALEQAMSASGLDDNSPCLFFCSGSTAHPFSRMSGGTSRLALSYAAKPWLEVGLQMTDAQLNETLGYDATTNAFLFLRQTVRSVAALVAVSPNGRLWVGAGPSINDAAVVQFDSFGGPTSHAIRPGVVLDLHFTTPAHSRMFFTMFGQYHYVGSATVGPFSTSGYFGSGTATMTATNAPFNHGVIGLGLGLRL